MTQDAGWDIIGFGVAAVDDVITARRLPLPNAKDKLLASSRMGGGQTATALVAAARLGCRCFYAGHFGHNEHSEFVRDIFRREGIAFREEVEFPAASPTHAIVIVDAANGDRSILWTSDGVVPPHIGDREKSFIALSSCLMVDQNFPECQIEAAACARGREIPVVGDFERIENGLVERLVALTDHLIVPLGMAADWLGDKDPERLVGKMLARGGRRLASVTDGVNGAWYAASDDPGAVRHQPAFVMPKVVDTNGCGDVFHGAYAACLVQGRPPGERIRRAAAVAAMKTRMMGGQTGTPRLEELETFLRPG